MPRLTLPLLQPSGRDRGSPILTRRPRRTQSAFTLIELIVVIAIIAILAALLFPVFAQARQKARQAQCLSNLRQLGMAFHFYAEDWDEVLPGPGYDQRGVINCWASSVGAGIEPYVRNSSKSMATVYVCPNQPAPDPSVKWSPRTYAMNAMLRNPPDVEPDVEGQKNTAGIPIAMIVEPAATVLLFEGTPDTTGYVQRWGDWTDVRGYWREPQAGRLQADLPWHDAVTNLLFCDGHARALPPAPRFPDRPQPGQNLWYAQRFRQ